MNISFSDLINSIIFIISFSVFLKKPVPVYLKFYPLYLFCQLIEGLYGEYTSDHGIYNTGFVNIYTILDVCFTLFILRAIIVSLKVKKIILFLMFFFSLFSLINIFLFQKKIGFNPINYTIGSLLIVSFCIYYFVELFQIAESQSLARLPSFWIASAILFTTVLVFPMYAMISFMEEIHLSKSSAALLLWRNMDSISNIIMILTYILLSIGFICRIRISKSIL